MTDSRQYPLVVMSEAEDATLARFGIGARFEAGTRIMFGHECKIVTDHHLGRFAMFVDETDTERIAEALNGGVTQVYVWRDDLAGDVVGTEQPAVVSDTAREGAAAALMSGSDGCICVFHARDAIERLIGLGWGPVVPVPTRETLQTELDRHEYAGNNLCECGDSWGGTSDGVVWTSETNRHISEALLALFSPVEGNTK